MGSWVGGWVHCISSLFSLVELHSNQIELLKTRTTSAESKSTMGALHHMYSALPLSYHEASPNHVAISQQPPSLRSDNEPDLSSPLLSSPTLPHPPRHPEETPPPPPQCHPTPPPPRASVTPPHPPPPYKPKPNNPACRANSSNTTSASAQAPCFTTTIITNMCRALIAIRLMRQRRL